MKFALMTRFGAAAGGSPPASARNRSAAATAQRLWLAAPHAVALMVATVIAITASQFLWLLLQPDSPAISLPPPVSPKLLAGELQARHLFGVVKSAPSGLDHVDSLRLLGTVVGAGIALVAADGGPARAFHVDTDIATGVRITSISPRAIEIDRHGVRESLQIRPGPRTVPQR